MAPGFPPIQGPTPMPSSGAFVQHLHRIRRGTDTWRTGSSESLGSFHVEVCASQGWQTWPMLLMRSFQAKPAFLREVINSKFTKKQPAGFSKKTPFLEFHFMNSKKPCVENHDEVRSIKNLQSIHEGTVTFILTPQKITLLICFEAFTLPTQRIHCSGRIQSQSAGRHRPTLNPRGDRHGVRWRWRCPGAAGGSSQRCPSFSRHPPAAWLVFREEISVS